MKTPPIRKNRNLFKLLKFVFLFLIICSSGNPNKEEADHFKSSSVKSFLDPEKPYHYKHPDLAIADSIGRLGPNYYAIAVEEYKRASNKLRKKKDWEGYAWALIRVCTYFQQSNVLINRWKEAKPYIDTLINEVPNHLPQGESHPFIGSAYFCKGTHHFNAFNVDLSKKAFQKALSIREKYFQEPSSYVAYVYFRLSELTINLEADLPKGIEYYNKGLTILNQSKDARSEMRGFFKVNGYRIFMERYQLIENHDKSISYGYRILDSINLLRPETASLFQLHAYNTIGKNLLAQGKLKPAKAILEKGRNTYLESPFFQNDDYYLLNNFLWMSQVNVALNDNKSAISLLNEIINLIDDGSDLNKENLRLKGDVFYELGTTLINTANYKSAYDNLIKAKSVYYNLTAPLVVEKAKVMVALGEIESLKQRFESALLHFDEAINLLIDRDQISNQELPKLDSWWDHSFLMDVLKKKGDAYLGIYYKEPSNIDLLESANKFYTRAIEQLINSFFNIDRKSDQFEFTRYSYPLFERSLNCLFLLDSLSAKEKYASFAIKISELSKAKSLYKQILELDETKHSGISKKLLFDVLSLKKEMAYLQKRIRNLKKEDPIIHEEVIALFNSKILLLESKGDSLQTVLTKLRGPLFVNDARSIFQDIDVVIGNLEYDHFLSYFWGNDHCYIIGNNNQGRLIFSREKLTNKSFEDIRDFAKILSNKFHIDSSQEDFRQFYKLAFNLYKKYVKPIEIIRSEERTQSDPRDLVIFSDGPLLAIPFETLISNLPKVQYVSYNKLSYLIKPFNISYSHSFSVLKYQQEKIAAPLRNPSVLAFDFYINEALPNNPYANRSGFVSLPGSAKEVKK